MFSRRGGCCWGHFSTACWRQAAAAGPAAGDTARQAAAATDAQMLHRLTGLLLEGAAAVTVFVLEFQGQRRFSGDNVAAIANAVIGCSGGAAAAVVVPAEAAFRAAFNICQHP